MLDPGADENDDGGCKLLYVAWNCCWCCLFLRDVGPDGGGSPVPSDGVAYTSVSLPPYEYWFGEFLLALEVPV